MPPKVRGDRRHAAGAHTVGGMSTADRPARIDLARDTGQVYKTLVKVAGTSRYFAENNGIGRDLAELVNVRVSQINGCLVCLEQHTGEAREAGVPQQKLDLLTAWRDSTLFDGRERAALGLAEALTLLPGPEELGRAQDDAAEHFDEDELAAIEWIAIAINAFNRVSIASGHQPRERR